jgi:hypothetical protein
LRLVEFERGIEERCEAYAPLVGFAVDLASELLSLSFERISVQLDDRLTGLVRIRYFGVMGSTP